MRLQRPQTVLRSSIADVALFRFDRAKLVRLEFLARRHRCDGIATEWLRNRCERIEWVRLHRRAIGGKATDDAEFWNDKIRAPHCFNPTASKTFLPIFLQKTDLVLAGKSKPQVAAAITSAFEKKELPALAPGAMCYMMAKQEYLSDGDTNWHPHLMFFVSGDAEKSWGANLPGSPVIAANDPQERATIFMVVAPTWSDASLNRAPHQRSRRADIWAFGVVFYEMLSGPGSSL